ncbi:MAG: hypothetical protein QW572_05245, partial [Candidatus Nitrosocaldus sp.]
MQRVDYVWMSYNSIHGISGYSLSIFDLEIYPILRLEQQEHEGSALAILNLLGYSYEPYPHHCSY